MNPVTLQPPHALWTVQNNTLFTLKTFRGITTATHIRANFKGELE